MKKLIIVANWKSYKTTSEAKEWIERFKIYDLPRTTMPRSSERGFNRDTLSEAPNAPTVRSWVRGLRFMNKKVVICPPFTLLPILASYLVNHKSSITLGAQDISPFGEGAYTGEINGKQLKEFVSFVLIGHSERRARFGETDEILTQKVSRAKEFGLTPVYCVQGKDTFIPKGVAIVAYEPVFAIGTGKPDTPQSAEEVALFLKENSGIQTVLYGGSVTPANVHSFTAMPHIDGVLVGSSSLDPSLFRDLIHHA